MKRATCLLLGLLPLGAACDDRNLTLCDITTSACQEDLYYADLRVRGDGYDPFGGMPPIRTISEDQYREELKAEAAAAPSTDASPWWDTALKLLHFVPETSVEETSIDNDVTNVAAYYSPESKSVTVVSHPVDPSQASDTEARLNQQIASMTTLAHELIHAIQDRELNLRHIPAASSDEYLAGLALIEGDASLYEDLVKYEIQLPYPYDWTSNDPAAYFSQWRAAYLGDAFSELGAPFFAAKWLIYPLGGAWLADTWSKGGNAAVRHSYGNAPKRSLDFLLGPGVAAPPEVPIDCFPASPGAAFLSENGKPYVVDALGALEFYAFLSAWNVPADDRLATAQQWRNDVIFVYYNQTTKKTAVAWHIKLGRPLSESVLAAITADGLRVATVGNSLMISATDDADLAATWEPTPTCH